MLFEPCGDLRKDYGAYCETLRLTEREDVYSAVHTSQDVARARAAAVAAVMASGDKTHSAVGSQPANLIALGSGAIDARDEDAPLGSHSASASHTLGPFGRAEEPEDAVTTAPAASTSAPAAGGKPGKAPLKPSRASAGLATPAAAAGAATTASGPNGGVDGSEEDTGPRLVERPNLFFLRLRHPGFCVNQRDMTPLCRAIPHCPSLVSIELVGCGLSVEGYMLLTEAVFKSRRVVAITVDFNCLARPGFLNDPTVQPATELPHHASPTEDDGHHTGEHTPTPPSSLQETPRTSSASGRGGQTRASTSSAGAKKKRNTKMSAAAAAAEAAAAAAAVMLAQDPDEPGAIYLKPTEFCGLHLLRSPLEDQIQEEREKKGKVDPKKQALLQQQNDTINALNVAHRIKVPRSWEGMLYTGVRHLSLRGNGITDDVVEKMLDILVRHPYSQLISLNLWGNAITDKGATLLADWLRHKDRRLRALDLGRNQIGDAGLLELTDVFRMRELATMDEVSTYRQQVLTRPNASPQERAAASQPMPAVYPSYQELYNAWFLRTYPEAAEEVVAAAAASAAGGGGGAGGSGAASGTTSARSGKETSTASGAAGGSGAAAGSGKRGAAGAGSKGKSAKVAAEVLPTLARPATAFDRHCVRVVCGGETVIRVPGNTVLEVLNMCENSHVTAEGAHEAARRLRLHEPATNEEMIALAGATFLTAFPGGAGPLGSATAMESAAESATGQGSAVLLMDAASNSIQMSSSETGPGMTLPQPLTSSRGSGAGHRKGSENHNTAPTTSPRRRASSKQSARKSSGGAGGSSTTTRKEEGRSASHSTRASHSHKLSVSTSGSAGLLGGVHPHVPMPAVVTTPELHCADLHLRSFGLFAHRYETHTESPAVAGVVAASAETEVAPPSAARLRGPEAIPFGVSTASTAVYGAGESADRSFRGDHQEHWVLFAEAQQAVNAALGEWCTLAEATAMALTASGSAAAGDEEPKGKKHGGLSSSVRPGSGKERKAAAPS